MKIREKELGYVVEVDKNNLDKTVTTGWAIWEFDFSEQEGKQRIMTNHACEVLRFKQCCCDSYFQVFHQQSPQAGEERAG